MFLFWSALAQAAKVVVLVHNPVVIWVDGKIVESPETGMLVTADGLGAGRHLVEARTALGKPLAATSVMVPQNGTAQLEYAEKVFNTLGDTSYSAGAYGTSVSTDGVSVTVVTGVPGGGVVMGVPMSPGMPTAPMAPAAPAVQVQTGPVEVQFLSTDGEWANVYVDGEKVAEFRNNTKGTVELTPGMHTVEIRDFMENAVWAKGQLRVGSVDPLKVGFSKKGTVEVYNDPNAWR